jgi:hypothetical protein
VRPLLRVKSLYLQRDGHLSHLTCRLSHVIGALKVCAYGANGAEVKKVGFLHAVADSVAAPC